MFGGNLAVIFVVKLTIYASRTNLWVRNSVTLVSVNLWQRYDCGPIGRWLSPDILTNILGWGNVNNRVLEQAKGAKASCNLQQSCRRYE